MAGYWIIFIVFMLASVVVSKTLSSKFERYSKEPLRAGLTGREVAEKMLRDQGIHDVTVRATQGFLTDYYDPRNKTVNLSEAVFNQNSVSAAAVAAHECGHAVQHATAYHWLSLRSVLVPVVQFGSRWSQWLLLAGLVLWGLSKAFSSAGLVILLIGIGLFALSTLFAFITLPVEYNASHRALVWLESSGLVQGVEEKHAEDALKWAARTYVVAALSSLATLLYYIALITGGRRN